MTKLKPCPFCGGEASFIMENEEAWAVMCENIDCEFVVETYDFHSKQEAIDAWNTRAEENSLYHFPKCTKYKKPKKQVKKIKSELKEFCKEKNNWLKIVECWDIIHACETWLRNNALGYEDIAKQHVERKNRKRGYYK